MNSVWFRFCTPYRLVGSGLLLTLVWLDDGRGQEQLAKSDLSRYVHSQTGELPIILSAPHGGTTEIPDVEKRNIEGLPTGGAGFVIARDSGTEELAIEVAQAVEKRLGKAPYLVVARTHRQFVDFNRPSEIAYEDPDAKPIYDFYHQRLTKYCDQVINRFRSGLLLDIHGQAVKRDTVFRGTSNGKTVKHLRETFGEAAHSGDRSLFASLRDRGWAVHPVPMTDKEQSGLTGGYIVRTYGSSQGTSIDAIQLEFGAEYRVASRRQETARILADAVADYAAEYLQLELVR